MRVIIAAMVICSSVWASMICLVPLGKSDTQNPISFFDTFVDSLVHSKIQGAPSRSAFRASMLRMVQDLECARKEIEPFKDSPNQLIRAASADAATAYNELAKTMTLIVEVSERSKTKKPKPGTPDLADLQMMLESEWDLLMKASTTATMAMMEPATEESGAHLRITDQQRQALLKKLASTFGQDIAAGLNVERPRATASPAIVAGFLANKKLPSANEVMP